MWLLACSDHENSRWLIKVGFQGKHPGYMGRFWLKSEQVRADDLLNVDSDKHLVRIGREWAQHVFEYRKGFLNQDGEEKWLVEVNLDQPLQVEDRFSRLMQSVNPLSDDEFNGYVDLSLQFRREVSRDLGVVEEPVGM